MFQFKNFSYSGKPVDIWALGIVLYFILTGVLPFSGSTIAQVRRLIINNQGLQPPSWLSTAAIDLICNLTSKQPNTRPSTYQLIQYARQAQTKYTSLQLESRKQIVWTAWLVGQIFPKAFSQFKPYPTVSLFCPN